MLSASERFVKLLTYQLLVNKVRLAKGVKERGLQKGENSRGTPLVVSTFCPTKAAIIMKYGSGHESGTADSGVILYTLASIVC